MRIRHWVPAAMAVGLLLALPTGATARRTRPRGPSPRKSVAAAILVHNSFANGTQDEFAGPDSYFAWELEFCHETEAASGEEREEHELRLRESAVGHLLAVKDLKEFNADLLVWERVFRAFGPRLRGRADRRKLRRAIARIAIAHTDHEAEFFHLQGVWTQIESVDCAAAEGEEREAEGVGSDAWDQEFAALVEVAHLFKVKRPPVEYPLGPYNPEPPMSRSTMRPTSA